MPMEAKLGMVVTYHEGLSFIKITWHFAHVVLRDHVTNWNHCISFTTVAMATKISRMVTYLKGILTTKSCNALITWSGKFTWQTKTIISTLLEWLCPLNLAKWWLILMGSCLESHMTLSSFDLARSRDKLKPLYLHYHSASDYQTW